MPTALLALMTAAGALPAASLPPGTWTNEEEVYFAGEAGRPTAPWIGVRIAQDGGVAAVDAFGKPVEATYKLLSAQGPDGLLATLADGRITLLRRARSVTCWSALRRDATGGGKADDWHFVRGITLHDQGGRAMVGEGVPGVRPVILRMRNVAWPSGPNRPSLVLYVHAPDSPASALSYVWADPGAARLGINLRWMQASCTIDGMEAPAAPARS